MVSNMQVQTAIEIAVKYHSNQVDKSGDLYILHPMRVMNAMDTNEERVIAILHDILEDTIVTKEYLLTLFPTDIVSDIEVLSKPKWDNYNDFILRIKENARAKKVKLADIEDNISYNRIVKLPEEMRSRLVNKYTKAKLLLI